MPGPSLVSASNERFQLDQWTALDYKDVLEAKGKTGVSWMAPTWTGIHRRRLQAYTALAAYRENSARLLRRVITQEQRANRDQVREYGDAALLLEAILAALIGDQQTIVVDGADELNEKGASANVDEASKAEAEAALRVQDRLREWAEDEQLATKLVETELNATSMGDGVYGLEWSSTKKRPRLRTWDPGAYFPILDDSSGLDYPTKVHIAREIVEEDGSTKGRIRRITYELVDVADEDGVGSYRVPWSDEPVTVTCFMSDGIFEYDPEVRSVEDLKPEKATWQVDDEGEIRDRDLGIDFIPIVHIPNTVAVEPHFGRSSLLTVLQLLDDIASADSDLQASSALTGGPLMWVAGERVADKMEVGPRKILKLGKDGRAGHVSGAEGLDAQQRYLDKLLHRLSTNSRVPEAVLGRIDPGEIEAGIVLSLSFGPLKALIDRMRLVRREKYRLLLKFVQRLNAKQDAADGAQVEEILTADLVFGSFLPSDLVGTAKIVMELYAAKVISLTTAQKMLQAVGVPIEDLAEEQAEIDRRDYEGANQLADLGAEKEVEKRLGIKLDRPSQEQAVGLNQQQPGSGEDDVDKEDLQDKA